MNRLLGELLGRNVLRVAAAYLVVGWLMMQIVNVMTPALNLPDWVDGFFAVLLIAGFPLALLLAWAIELTPEGMRLTTAAEAAEAPRALVNTDFAIIGLLVIVTGIAGYQIATRPPMPAPRAVNTLALPALPAAVSDASIAVLPFADLSPDGDQEYFSDGTSEEILNVLVRVQGLRVASRTSAFAYKGTGLRIPDIAGELGVRHILEGSVRRSGDNIRVTAQLIDAQTDEHLWSQTYDRTLTTENLFAIQDEISQAIVTALSSRIAGLSPVQPLQMTPDTADVAILDLYYEANALFIARGVDDLMRATTLFEEITARDPRFARGWAGLAMVYTVSTGWGLPPRDYYNLAHEAAARAIAINPALSSAYAALGDIETMPGHTDWMSAMANFEIALELDPNDANIYNWRARLWSTTGFSDRALEDFRTCLRLDPAYINCRYNQFSKLSSLGRHAEADAINHQLLLSGTSVHLTDPHYLQHLADIGDDNALLLALNLTVGQDSPETDWLIDELFRAYRDPHYDRLAGYRRVQQRLGGESQALFNRFGAPLATAFQYFDTPFIAEMLTPTGHARALGMTRAQSRALIEATRLPEFWHAYEFPPGCRPVGAADYDCDWMPAQ